MPHPAHLLLASLADRGSVDECDAWLALGLLDPARDDLACLLRDRPSTTAAAQAQRETLAVRLLDAGASFGPPGTNNGLAWAAQHDLGDLVARLLAHPACPPPARLLATQRLAKGSKEATGHFLTELAHHDRLASLAAALRAGLPLPPDALAWATPSSVRPLRDAGAQLQSDTVDRWAHRVQAGTLTQEAFQSLIQATGAGISPTQHAQVATTQLADSLRQISKNTLFDRKELTAQVAAVPSGAQISMLHGKTTRNLPLAQAVWLQRLRCRENSHSQGQLTRALLPVWKHLRGDPATTDPGVLWFLALALDNESRIMHQPVPTSHAQDVQAWSGQTAGTLWEAAARTCATLDQDGWLDLGKSARTNLADLWTEAFWASVTRMPSACPPRVLVPYLCAPAPEAAMIWSRCHTRRWHQWGGEWDTWLAPLSPKDQARVLLSGWITLRSLGLPAAADLAPIQAHLDRLPSPLRYLNEPDFVAVWDSVPVALVPLRDTMAERWRAQDRAEQLVHQAVPATGRPRHRP